MPHRPLGRHQLTALNNLASLNSGTWYRGCGWQVGTHAETERILDSLVERQLATRTTATKQYKIAEAGLNRLGWWTCRDCTRLTRYPHHGHFLGADRHVRCTHCYSKTTVGACERCGGACQRRVPGPRLRIGNLKVSPTCHALVGGAVATAPPVFSAAPGAPGPR